MRKQDLILLILWFGALLWSGCGPQPASEEVERAAPVAGGGAIMTVAPPATLTAPTLPTATSMALVSPLNVATTTVQSVTGWSPYTTTNGLSIEYPSGWETRNLGGDPANPIHYFSPPGFNPPDTISNEQIMLSVAC